MAKTGPLRCRSLHLPKRGNTRDEYEDAVAADPGTGRFAIADGASESAFAGAWAKVAAEAFVATRGPWSMWLPAARTRWHEMCSREEMPWFVEDKFQLGAFATMLGLAVERDDQGPPHRWRAWAVGDCCLFQIRKDALICAFPLTRSTDFGNQPALLGSRARAGSVNRSRVKGLWRGGDQILLMSDALAQWCLRDIEEGGSPWQVLAGAENAEDFRDVIEALRDKETLRNDDVTLLVVW